MKLIKNVQFYISQMSERASSV